MFVTDAQVHLWEPSRPDLPWPAGAEVSGQHRRYAAGFGAEAMLAAMDTAGVHRAVIVPPSWVGEHNQTALEAAASHPDRFAVMGRFDPEAPDAGEQLQGWLEQPGMLGIRMTFNNQRHAPWLEGEALDWFWGASERLGVPLMLSVAGMVPRMAHVARRHPGLTLIIDHLGARRMPDGTAVLGDVRELLALASLPNVLVKATCLPALSVQPYPYRDIHPLLKGVYEAFGPRRMLWGSDYTRLRGTYGQCLGLIQDALDFLSAGDREWIAGKALAGALRWPEAPPGA